MNEEVEKSLVALAQSLHPEALEEELLALFLNKTLDADTLLGFLSKYKKSIPISCIDNLGFTLYNQEHALACALFKMGSRKGIYDYAEDVKWYVLKQIRVLHLHCLFFYCLRFLIRALLAILWMCRTIPFYLYPLLLLLFYGFVTGSYGINPS